MMTTLRVLTYNLYFGGADRLEDIYTVLAHVDADVIALTEADDPAVVATLAERLGLHDIWAEGSGDRHIATLSRFPILDWQIYRQPPLTQAVLETKLVTPAGPITTYNAHFLPTLLLPFEIRRWQAVGKLLQVIGARRPGPHLIMGDLNAIASGDRVLQHNNPARMRRLMALQLNIIFRLAVPRLLKAGYVDCFRHLHPHDDGFTWMPSNPTTRYDYILADSILAAKLQRCRVIDDLVVVCTASDHFPLLAEFVI
ncbi:MAG: endonuclease/exonuclease/phosphatase family protein [Chloroflexi bacterium]|nr:endonuclease/exonuclease/phosphatase family protein [Chloroflexota bacterium]